MESFPDLFWMPLKRTIINPNLTLQVLQAPESSPRPRPRPKPTRPRNSTLSTVSAYQRYGVSDSTVEAYKTASAGRRASSVYGDAKALEKLRHTISTGFQTATDTG